MFVIFSVFYILVAAAMIVLILLQNGAGADAGSGFGAGASATVFGARGSATFLTRATAILAGLFFLLSLSMGIIMAGGTAVAWVLERLPWLIYVGAVVLLVVAGNLMAEDRSVQALVGHPDWLGWAVSGGLALVVIGALAAGRARTRRRAAARAAARRTESEIVKV